jgi:hypothetical protein
MESFSEMAWGEREVSNRSAKWSAAMVVATFAALLIFCNFVSYPMRRWYLTTGLIFNRNLEY